MPGWAFLSSHGYALLCIARNPDSRLRDIGDSVGITERAAHALVNQLVEGGYLKKERHGNRNRYEVQRNAPMRHPLIRHQTLGQFLDALGSDIASPDSTVAP
jgi:predicted transcriptional regulator